MAMKKWIPWALGAGAVAFLATRSKSDTEPSTEGMDGVVGPQPRKTVKTVKHEGPVGKPWSEVVKEEDLPPRAESVYVTKTQELYATAGEPVSFEFTVPGGTYEVVVRAMLPDIGWAVKIGGESYGIGQGPPGSTPVLSFIAGAVNAIARIAPAVAGDAYSAAAAAAVKAISSIADKIPDAVKKARVKLWTRFRAVKPMPGMIRKKTRDKVKAAIRKWYDPDRLVAGPYGERRGYWRFAGDGPGTWPLVSDEPPAPPSGTKPIDTGEPITMAPPEVFVTQVVGDYLQIEVTTAPAAYTGEIRYDIAVYSHEG
jgi:hypothetical protein